MSEIPDKEIKTDEKSINHLRNVKLLQALYGGKKFYVECFPTDIGAIHSPNSNFAVKEIELPNFDLFEEKLGYKWRKEPEAARHHLSPVDYDLIKRAMEYAIDHCYPFNKTEDQIDEIYGDFIKANPPVQIIDKK